MLAKQKQQIEMYERVQSFLAVTAPPPSAGYTAQKAVLDDVVGRLTNHSDNQRLGQRQSEAETVKLAALRKTLLKDNLAPIAKIARASFRDVPGIEVALKMPPRNIATTRLVADAQAIRKAIAKYEPAFIDAGRPENFLSQLDAAISALTQSQLGKAEQKGTHIGARQGIAKEIQRGRKAVDLIDTMMTTAYATQPDVIARWRTARRIQLVIPQAAGTTADENTPTPTPAPALVASTAKAA